MIAVVPPGYRCEGLVAELAGRTQEYTLTFWLVADPRPAGDRKPMPLKELKACAGTAHNGTPQILEDRAGVLAAPTRPPPARPARRAPASPPSSCSRTAWSPRSSARPGPAPSSP
ncbi:hypothetical protein ACFQY7_46670 [Actinomadura luteofluorescens]|uniref:hypothetical protein n=1 Tax=Actinomadura luteofluorescens TaxID=46163 RepID=UPI00363DC1BF